MRLLRLKRRRQRCGCVLFECPKLVDRLLRNLQLNPESHLVVVNGEMVTGDHHLTEDDTVEIVSAISGG